MTEMEVLALTFGDIIEVQQPDGTWREATFREYSPQWGAVDMIGYSLGYSVSPLIDGSMISHISFDRIRRPRGD